MKFFKFAKDLLDVRDYLLVNEKIINPDVIIFVDCDGTAIQMDDVEISLNGNCIQFLVK